MYGIAVALVLGSGFFHSVWNLYTKKSIDKNVFLWCCQAVAIVVFLPWTILDWEGGSLTAAGCLIILASMALHGLYVRLLAAAYAAGDMSQVYPIMRGTSPLLVPLLGAALLGERLTLIGWMGVVTIVIGMAALSHTGFRRRQSDRRAPMLALAVGICISSYIVVDKIALDHVSPIVLNELTNVGNLLALSLTAIRSEGIAREIRAGWRTILLGGVLAPGAYILFLFALALAPAAQLAPMREIGTVFGTVLAVGILRERQGARRIAASLLITAGIVVLGIWG
ncbi:DMT family transporter [Cohnella sp. 56]|uniref:DMT family transporter n=1 Tax=Cohnella sp. 56 TaxID=3113722 RepID=UPI0030EB01AE